MPLKGGKEIAQDQEKINIAWEDAAAFIQSLKPDEVFDPALSSEEILHRLFHLNNLQISGQKNFEFGCRCSKEKLKNTLSSFEPKDLDDMCDDKGCIEAVCNFCGRKYTFARADLTSKQKYLQ